MRLKRLKIFEPSEKQIENEILSLLRWAGVFAWKVQSTGIWDERQGCYRRSKNRHHIKGVSDILGIYHGRLIAIEVKSHGGRTSLEQSQFIDRIKAEGGLAFVARSTTEAAEMLLSEFSDLKRLLEFLRNQASQNF